MLRKKTMFMVVLCLVLALSMMLVGCENAASDASESTADESSSSQDDVQADTEDSSDETSSEEILIAFCGMNDTDVFQRYVKDLFLEAGEAMEGVTVKSTDAQGNVETQLNQIDNFIAEEVDAIVVAPVDSEGTAPGIEACIAADIPVVSVVSQVAGDLCLEVRSNYYQRGQQMAEALCEVIPENGTYCLLNGTAGYTHSTEGRLGVIETFEELRPDVTLLAEMDGDYLRTEGLRITKTGCRLTVSSMQLLE